MRETDRNRQTNKGTYEQMDEQAGEHTDRIAERQMNRQADMHPTPCII
jgi:hypothetical protein